MEWDFDHLESLRGEGFRSDTQVVKVKETLRVGSLVSRQGSGYHRETLSRLTACVDKIYTPLGPFDSLAEFHRHTRFVLRLGDDHKGGTCTFENGTLELSHRD